MAVTQHGISFFLCDFLSNKPCIDDAIKYINKCTYDITKLIFKDGVFKYP